MLGDGHGHLLETTLTPSTDPPFVACPTLFVLPAGRKRKCGLTRRSTNPHNIARTWRRERNRATLQGSGVGGCTAGRNSPPPPEPQLPERRKSGVSEEDSDECCLQVGKNMVEYCRQLFKDKEGQCQLAAPLLHKMAVGTDKKNSVLVSSLASLLDCEPRSVKKMIERGTDAKLEVVADQTRPRTKRGSYVGDAEAKCTRKFVASCGELFSSSNNRYKITISPPEVFTLYKGDGVKTILLTMLTQFRDDFKPRVEKYRALSEEEKITEPKKGLTKALYAIQVWKENNFEGECGPILWKRSKKRFWKIVNARQKESRKKIMRIYFGVKLHPCQYCDEFDEEIKIYEELLKSYTAEQDEDLKAEMKKRLDQWSRKIQALLRHKDKHEMQRTAFQKWKAECKDLPGTCLVYEDFCNLYEANNAKMLNLVMVLLYWNGKEVQQEYYDTFSRGSLTIEDVGDLALRGSQDNHVYRECWLAAFEAKTFSRFHTIFKTGDNGSALKSYDTFHLHSVLMEKHFVRIIYFTLCPYHAENHCDPAGARTKKAIAIFERKKGNATGDAESTAAARNSIPRPNLKTAKAVEAIQEFSEYMPEEMIRKKQSHWPYSLGQCCVVFLQLTDVHENKIDPLRTIQLGPCGFCAPTVKDKFGVIDLRYDTLDKTKICIPCSKRFQRSVLKTEHNQKGFFLCPKTNVYRRETKESLTRICLRCNKQVQIAHTESPNQSAICPSIAAVRGTVLHKHKTFHIETIDGWQRYQIITEAKTFTPANVTPAVLADIRSRYRPVKKPGLLPTTTNNSSVTAARMMAPGVTVVYQIDAAGREARGCALPWGVGVCNLVNPAGKNFEVTVFLPTVLAAPEAPWSTWEPTAGKKVISFADACWMKVNKMSKNKKSEYKIPTKVLYQIWQDKRFAWKWISLLDPKQDDVDLDFESS